MATREAWLRVLGSALGVGAIACADAPAATPLVASREVSAWDATAPIASTPLAEDASVSTIAESDAANDAASPSTGSAIRLASFDVHLVARPTTRGTPPKPPPDPCAKGRKTPSCIAAANCGPVDTRAALRAGLSFEVTTGLSPKSDLDADAAAEARRVLTTIERQSSLCALADVEDSVVATVKLDVGGDGELHASITGRGVPSSFASCLSPLLTRHGVFARETPPATLTFDIALGAVWS